jgi:hypothetical protein
MNTFVAEVEDSGWLTHVKSVLETFMAKAVSDGVRVVVHCSDGWDRTAQTCGLKISFKINFVLKSIFQINFTYFYFETIFAMSLDLFVLKTFFANFSQESRL